MTAIVSIVLALTAVMAAWLQPDVQPALDGIYRMQTPVYFAVLLFITLLAFAAGRRIPKWKLSHHVSEWSSLVAAGLVALIGLHHGLGLDSGMGWSRPATPGNVTYVPSRPKEKKPLMTAKRPAPAKKRSAAAASAPESAVEETPSAPESAAYNPDADPDAIKEPPAPAGKIRIIVRDENGDEYPYDMTPGEELPPNLTNISKLAQMVMAYGAWTEIKANKGGHFVVRAEINNTPILALIDTGASAVALSHEDAEAVGLNTFALDYTIPVATANGVVKAAPVTLRRIEIDGVVVRDVKAWVMPKGALRGTLMGMSFLSHLSGFSVDDGKLTLKQ